MLKCYGITASWLRLWDAPTEAYPRAAAPHYSVPSIALLRYPSMSAVRSALAARPGAVVCAAVFHNRIGLGGTSSQPALVIALSERHTPRAQNIVCGDDVKIEVGQRKRKDEGLRRER
jgi:hypothetical protein